MEGEALSLGETSKFQALRVSTDLLWSQAAEDKFNLELNAGGAKYWGAPGSATGGFQGSIEGGGLSVVLARFPLQSSCSTDFSRAFGRPQ